MFEETYKNIKRKILSDISDQERMLRANTIKTIFKQYEEEKKEFFRNYKQAKNRGIAAKFKSLQLLSENILKFELKSRQNDNQIFYAETVEDVYIQLSDIIPKTTKPTIIRTHSNILSELDIDTYLKKNFSENQIQDLSKRNIPQINNSFSITTPQESLDYISKEKEKLKDTNQSIMLCEPDFLLADCGAMVFNENSADKLYHFSLADVCVVIVGIDKMLSSIDDLSILQTLGSTQNSGNLLPCVQNLVFKGGENIFGRPRKIYVFIVDNGRSKILQKPKQRVAMQCISCGACEALCPIQNQIGFNLQSDYTMGPIQNVKAPFLKGFYMGGSLAYLCLQCGKCTNVCPMNIPISDLVLANRKLAVEKGFVLAITKARMKRIRKMCLKRKTMESFYTKYSLKLAFSSMYGNQKQYPEVKGKSFHEQYKEKNQ